MPNIVLLGMPGCGKTAIGQVIAHLINRPFFDTDTMVEQKSGLTVWEIFSKQGESIFRALEKEAITLASSENGRVIASGGGVVLDKQNYDILANNGRLYYIERDLNLLPTEGRPLSFNIQALYKARLPIYISWAEVKIINNTSIKEAAQHVISAHFELIS